METVLLIVSVVVLHGTSSVRVLVVSHLVLGEGQ